MNRPRIIGIVLVRDEDLFLERAVRNASRFCDEWVFCDHGSKDKTSAILQDLAKTLPHARYLQIEQSRESHNLLQPYVGRDCWIFGLDGDEIYDPEGLDRLRVRLQSGEFREWWMVLGNVLHVTRLEAKSPSASGYLAPPCRSMTKLYNFAAIDSWDGSCPERLHGGNPVFRLGFASSRRMNMHESVPWDKSDFRCLHLCFQRRSSLDPEGVIRPNIMESIGSGGLAGLLRTLLGRKSRWKESRYMRGPLVTVNACRFFGVGNAG